MCSRSIALEGVPDLSADSRHRDRPLTAGDKSCRPVVGGMTAEQVPVALLAELDLDAGAGCWSLPLKAGLLCRFGKIGRPPPRGSFWATLKLEWLSACPLFWVPRMCGCLVLEMRVLDCCQNASYASANTLRSCIYTKEHIRKHCIFWMW